MVWSLKLCCVVGLVFTAAIVRSQHLEPRTNHKEVNSSDYLWVCAVYEIGNHFLIGTGLILTNKWVLTPAHFWDNQRFTEKTAAIKYNATINQQGEGAVGTIGEIFPHPKYHHRDQDQVFNVAMLLMAEDMKLGWNYRETLPIEDENLVYSPGEQCEVTGYGMDENQKPDDLTPRRLRTIQVEIKDKFVCLKKMFFSQEMFCAGTEGENLCPGDEGAIMKCGDRIYGMFVKGQDCPSTGERVNVYMQLGTMKRYIVETIVHFEPE